MTWPLEWTIAPPEVHTYSYIRYIHDDGTETLVRLPGMKPPARVSTTNHDTSVEVGECSLHINAKRLTRIAP
jgi:hypothetical protein